MELPKRKSIRLKNYNYSSNGVYFITICTHNRKCLFGEIVGNGLDRSSDVDVNGMIRLSQCGEIVKKDLENLSQHFSHITVDKYVIMPNHIHVILLFESSNKMERSRPFPTISTVIGLYKSGVSRKIGHSIWQKSFYDHIIRNDKSYYEIWNYIDTNPLKWELDCYHVK